MSEASGTKVCLTAEFVDHLVPPQHGEIWIGDNHLNHFGIRAWAGKSGGNKAFAIRLRDKSGKLVRETYSPERDWDHHVWLSGLLKPDGYFLDLARRWAADRIAFHRGWVTRDELRRRSLARNERRVLTMTLQKALELRLRRLRRQSKNPAYLDPIEELLDRHISPQLAAQTLGEISEIALADAITDRGIPYGNLRRLRAFVSGAFKEQSRVYGPLGLKLEEFQEQCRKNLDARTEPPYPAILKITQADFRTFFDLLECNPRWQQALAIRLYFATDARMQQVLTARWSDILESKWYPFMPNERGCWFEACEQLDDSAHAIIKQITDHHKREQIQSLYLFPSPEDGVSQPIKTVQRMWSEIGGTMGWNGLPLSHVVQRHRPRTNPSYYLDFSRMFFGPIRESEGRDAVSKVGKRRRKKNVFSDSCSLGQIPR